MWLLQHNYLISTPIHVLNKKTGFEVNKQGGVNRQKLKLAKNRGGENRFLERGNRRKETRWYFSAETRNFPRKREHEIDILRQIRTFVCVCECFVFEFSIFAGSAFCHSFADTGLEGDSKYANQS
jgi:hypothetical protein